MMLDWPTFVLQRRINRPLGRGGGRCSATRTCCAPAPSSTSSIDGMYLQLDGPFGVMFPPFGLDGASWWAPASVRTRRGRIDVPLRARDQRVGRRLDRAARATAGPPPLPVGRSPLARVLPGRADCTADRLTGLLVVRASPLRCAPCSDSSTSTVVPRSSTTARGTTSPRSRGTRAFTDPLTAVARAPRAARAQRTVRVGDRRRADRRHGARCAGPAAAPVVRHRAQLPRPRGRDRRDAAARAAHVHEVPELHRGPERGRSPLGRDGRLGGRDRRGDRRRTSRTSRSPTRGTRSPGSPSARTSPTAPCR